MKLTKIRAMLARKGYDIEGKSEGHLRMLYGFYVPQVKAQPNAKVQWKSWGGTNRLRQFGGAS